MEVLIPLIWGLSVFVIPVALFVIGYIAYLNEVKISEITLKLILAFVVYFCTTSAAIPFIFILVFAGAHSDPVGQTLDTKGNIFYSSIVLIYIFINWLMCSFVNNGFIKPWLIFHRERGNNSSIFGEE